MIKLIPCPGDENDPYARLEIDHIYLTEPMPLKYARLFASAPALLEACQLLLTTQLSDNKTSMGDVLNKAYEAVYQALATEETGK